MLFIACGLNYQLAIALLQKTATTVKRISKISFQPQLWATNRIHQSIPIALRHLNSTFQNYISRFVVVTGENMKFHGPTCPFGGSQQLQPPGNICKSTPITLRLVRIPSAHALHLKHKSEQFSIRTSWDPNHSPKTKKVQNPKINRWCQFL